MRVTKLQQKFEIIAAKMKGSVELPSSSASGDASGDGGLELTQAYYIIAFAQEREELVAQGNKLDTTIKYYF